MRIRTVKPEFFQDERLYDLEVQTGLPIRVIFIGMWCVSDREGRFDWNPRRLKVQILPHDEAIDFGAALTALETGGFIIKYQVGDKTLGCVPGFASHQVVNNRERDSSRPEPPELDRPKPPKDAESKPVDQKPADQKKGASDLDKRAYKVFRAFGLKCDRDELWRLGGDISNMIMSSAQMLDDDGVAQICRNAEAWRKSSTWIKDLTPRLILSKLGEIYSHQAEDPEKPRRLLL